MPEITANPLRRPPQASARHPDAAGTWRLLADREPARLDGADRRRILGVLRYADHPDAAPDPEFPLCPVPLPALDTRAASVVLLGQQPTERLRIGAADCCTDGQSLFGVIVDDTAMAARIEGSTYALYRSLLHATAEAGFPHLCRIWNYLPDINAEPGGREVYQAFSIGRREALDDWGLIADGALPAACAIGTRRAGLRIAFLASRQAPMTLSNVRQSEAYRYPTEYGPKSPAFSRAVLMASGTGQCLHVSGTSSIHGYRTVHEGNLRRQIVETLDNLAALLAPQGLSLREPGSGTLLTVYLRHAADLTVAEPLLAAAVAPEIKRLFLQGDICRRSLLVEIEGIMDIAASAV